MLITEQMKTAPGFEIPPPELWENGVPPAELWDKYHAALIRARHLKKECQRLFEMLEIANRAHFKLLGKYHALQDKNSDRLPGRLPVRPAGGRTMKNGE